MKYSQILEACWKGYHREGNKKMFGKTYPNCVKNKAKNESTLTEFDPGEGNYGPFQIYIGTYATGKQFATESEALDEIEFLMRADPKSANDEWKIKDALGKTVWEHDPGAAADDARRQERLPIQFMQKPPDDAVAESANPKLDQLIKMIQAGKITAAGLKDPALRPRIMQLVQQADPQANIAELVATYAPTAQVKATNVNDLKAQARSGNVMARLPKTSAGTPSYAQQFSTFEQGVAEAGRVARKAGQPANSKKHSDLYTDENPRGTITGLKFATPEDARASVTKIRNSGRSHAHKIQAAVAMEQRARAAGKASAAAVYRRYINANKKTNEEQLAEKCWDGYSQQGMKKKGDRQVPNCVPVSEVKIGNEIGTKELLYRAAAQAIQDAAREGIDLDYETAIKQASKLYGISYQPSELPRLQAQRAEIDRQLALLKQGRQVVRQRRAALKAPTPAGTDEYWQTNALPTGRIKPAAKSLEEQELTLAEDLKQWFKQKWVRFGPDGKIRGACARGKSSEGKSKCLPQAKAHALGKKGRAKAGARKRRKDPDANRSGRAINVKTKEDVMTATPISRRPSAIAQGMRRAARVNEFVSGDGSGNEPDFNPETFYDIPKLKKVYKQLASRSVNSGWYDFQLTRLISAMEDLYTINADVLDEMFPTAPEIANYIERNIIKAFPSETPPYIIKNPDYKPRAPRAAGPAVKESLRAGEYYIAQVTLDTGEVKQVKVTSDEGYDDAIRRHYAAKGRQVVDIDMDFDIQSPVMAEDREQKTNCARTKSAVCQCESVNKIMEDRKTLTAICVLEHGDGVQGTILLKQQPGSPTFIAGEITGLQPGQHGFHIHEFGDLSRGCESAGAHYNPDGMAHGDLERGHVGDLGNITADQSGRAEFAIVAQRVNLTGDQSVVGRAIVVHSKQDDLGKGGNAESRKSGNAGDRLACGVITLKATVNEAASPAQQAAIAINMKKAGIKPKVKENLRPGESIPAKSIIQGYTVFFDPATRMVSVTRGGVDADAAIEQEQISKPTMLAFNSAVYRMITRIEDETEPVLKESIPFDQCPGCGGPIVHVTMLREKQDACYHKVKSRYKVWPSAYASGALVQCRKKGAANWGNSKK